MFPTRYRVAGYAELGWWVGVPRTQLETIVTSEVLALFGPTASGKSAVAEQLATQLQTEVVSADALQVYRGLPILTNQPTAPTRLVGFVALDDEMSVGAYAELAHGAIDELVSEHSSAVVSGGTGLYLRAALVDMAIPAAPVPGARARWEAAYDADPVAAHAHLAAADAPAADAVHPNDRRRVVRALELAEAGASLAPERDRLWSGDLRRPTTVVGLDVPPDELERRIRHRTREMFAAGVVYEVRAALAAGVSKTAEQALGLREIASLPEHEAEERIVVRTRQYAAYQRKWMRRIPGLVLVDGTRPSREVADAVLEVARTR
jgi:tRNA dimethylallyltransferase